MTVRNPGSSGGTSHGQASGLLACIAVMLLVAALALHFVPSGQDLTSSRIVEMPEVDVVERQTAEVRTPLTGFFAALVA